MYTPCTPWKCWWCIVPIYKKQGLSIQKYQSHDKRHLTCDTMISWSPKLTSRLKQCTFFTYFIFYMVLINWKYQRFELIDLCYARHKKGDSWTTKYNFLFLSLLLYLEHFCIHWILHVFSLFSITFKYSSQGLNVYLITFDAYQLW